MQFYAQEDPIKFSFSKQTFGTKALLGSILKTNHKRHPMKIALKPGTSKISKTGAQCNFLR